jgi:hypothetical protein
LRLAYIVDLFDIKPVMGIEFVLEELARIFEHSSANSVAVTYSISADVVGKLQKIAPNLRIFCGRATKAEKIRGAYVTPAQTHFKGIMMWDDVRTVYYIGSSNLTNETAGNYGILVVKDGGFDFFSVNLPKVIDYAFGDPFLPIFNEIVFQETRGICEYTGKQYRALELVDGKFKGRDVVEFR